MPNFHTDPDAFMAAFFMAAGLGSAHDAQRQSEEEGPELCQQVAAMRSRNATALEVFFFFLMGLLWFNMVYYGFLYGLMMGFLMGLLWFFIWFNDGIFNGFTMVFYMV